MATVSTIRRTTRSVRLSKPKPIAKLTFTAVQGYDAAQLLGVGLDAVGGKIEDEANLYKAMRSAKLDSPRGPVSFSPSQEIVQNIYLRKATGGLNKVTGIAAEALADPGTGCKLG